MVPPADSDRDVTAPLDMAHQGTLVLPSTTPPPLDVAPTATPVSGGPINPDDALPPGTLVHQFEIIRELGRGGMGRVYLARDVRLARKVALKFLLASSDELRQRFVVEARNTARCQHDNIVVIYEVDEWNGAPYMALEFLDGTSLADVIEDHTLLPARAIEITIGIARALVRAHELGIVHCDLKPDNVLLTSDGGIKVVDFGIARLLGTGEDEVSGTPRYMAPEQWGVDTIDARTDLWAVGIIIWELLSRSHPLGTTTMPRLVEAAATETPMPRLSTRIAGITPNLDRVVARCLEKKKADRYQTARELLVALEELVPRGRDQALDGSPFPGMTAFDEADADRFFGRTRDKTRIATTLAEVPLVVIAGPSGVGKSSLVRAGVLPALKNSGDSWSSIVVRPGRDPFGALASRLEALGLRHDPAMLRAQPGQVGVILRDHALSQAGKLLVFVDQFEETFTNVDDPAVRGAFIAALAGIADDKSSPLRVVLSVRSDYLDRLADEPALRGQLGAGLVFVRALGSTELREALERPLEATGFRFEPGVVDAMIADAGDTPGTLPLVQFVAAALWDARDRERQLLTRAAYTELGGIAGALANHAEQVVRELPAAERALLDRVLGRLLTVDNTRAVVDREEIERELPNVGPLLDRLIAARLVTADDMSIELVHESLIHAWPTLRRWREERGEHAAYLAQVRTAAKQWSDRGRPSGLLWSGEALAEVRLFRQRYRGDLAPREREFLDAAIALADRGARRRRRAVIAGLIAACLVAVGALAAVLVVGRARDRADIAARDAQQALDNKLAADREREQAEAARARAAEEQRAAEEAKRAADSGRVAAEQAQAAALSDREHALGLKQQADDDRDKALAAARAEAKRAREEQAKTERALADARVAKDRAEKAEAEQRRRAEAAEKKASGLAKKLE